MDFRKKILLIGSPNCGKTAYMSKLITNIFNSEHVPTINGCQYNISFKTNKGDIIFDTREYNMLNENIYKEQWDGCIVMFDLSVRGDCAQAIETLIHLKNTISHIPTIIIGNKIDISISIENIKTISDDLENGDVYFSMSVKNSYNIQKAYVYLSKILFDNS